MGRAYPQPFAKKMIEIKLGDNDIAATGMAKFQTTEVGPLPAYWMVNWRAPVPLFFGRFSSSTPSW
jgi:hypothetical protein